MPKPPIRVLHVAHSLGMGGTEKVLQLFTSQLDRERYLPLVFAMQGGAREAAIRAAGIPVSIAAAGAGAIDAGKELFRVLKRVQPHIVHLHRAGWPDPALMRPLQLHCMDGARRKPLPRIFETNVFGRTDGSPAGRLIDRHCFVSRFCAERYARDNDRDVSTPQFAVLYNPVDTDFYARACPQRHVAAPAVIGRLSRPDPGKWSPLAWEMFPEVLRAVPQARYAIMGMVDIARDWFVAQGVWHAVEEVPPALEEPALAAFFTAIRCLAHANHTGESFGLVIAEAMAAGVPVVTHRCPDPKDNAQAELVENGHTGFVVDSTADYAQAVIRLLLDPSLARAMGEAGRAKAQAQFRMQDITRSLEAHYEALLESVPRSSG